MLLNCCVVQDSESPLDCKEIQRVHPKGNQSWILIEKTDAEAETPILWPPDAKNWVLGKDADAGNDWRQEDKGTTEDEMVGWHHRLNEHEFEQALGIADGQGSLTCYSPRGRKESDNWETELTYWLPHCLIYLIYFWLLWVFLAACGLSLVAESGDSSPVVVHWLLIALVSLVSEDRF